MSFSPFNHTVEIRHKFWTRPHPTFTYEPTWNLLVDFFYFSEPSPVPFPWTCQSKGLEGITVSVPTDRHSPNFPSQFSTVPSHRFSVRDLSLVNRKLGCG